MLRTPAEWEAFWRQVKREMPRPLDAAQEIAVVIQLGERRTAGFEARVLSARIDNRTLLVTYEEIAPGPGAISAQVLTSPWVVAVVQRTDLPVEFRRITAIPKSAR